MLKMLGINKAFNENRVLMDVDFCVKEGEIHALIGENGAGKSTLMNILGGVLPCDSGTITLKGKDVRFLRPRDAMDAGIAFIHQELNLINDLTVYENIFIGRELKTRAGLVDKKEMSRRSSEILKRMGIQLDPGTLVKELDASYKQIVEIARALMMNARLIIMDEPTTSLTDVEIGVVFKLMRTLKSQGVSIIFISHKLGEILSVCDAYTVLRDGHMVHTAPVAGATADELAYHMVGHSVRTEKLHSGMQGGKELLRGENLSGRGFENVTFTLHAGEILGFTGLLGDGRSELFSAVFGVEKLSGGQLWMDGKTVQVHSPRQARALGIGYVPRNRKENGIIKDMSILNNGTLVTLDKYKKLLISGKKQRAAFGTLREKLRIKMEREENLITSLSGGNQQKVVLSKWLAASPKVLIFDNPTQGVDVGAKEDIYDIIVSLAREGVGIVILSSEAQEIIRLCDRVQVMYHGRSMRELGREEMNEYNIMLLATGGGEVKA
ncbi:MAG: sugar ABC transporter ATP-binding protein [Clostridia bacterium]|nr:sugar ABC transporter ATP-binding protein [Clostridia bacterium]